MRFSFVTNGSRLTITAILFCGIAVLGCTTPFRSSGIDPTGDRFFTNPPPAPNVATVPVCPPTPACPPARLEPYCPPTTAIQRQPATGLPMATGSQLAAGVPPSTGPIMGAMSGGYREFPGRMLPSDNTQVIVSPVRTIAPVGSEIVLLAGVRGQDQYLRTNERVEWTIGAGSVGKFLDYGKGTWTDLLFGDFTRPHKVSPTLAITSTSRQYLRLSRETPTPDDDINVLRGQTWVTVTSASEGVSYVTAFAPSVYGWLNRKQTATIHWIDVQWKLPTPAILPAGTTQPLTTVVTRQTDGAPCVGWKVLYSYTGGVSAGFGPQGAANVTVLTDQCGRATTELVQSQPASGTGQVNIYVIRPAKIEGAAGKDLKVGGGATTVTWTSSELTLRKTGPAASGVGQPVKYRIDISNPGAIATDGVTVTDEIPSGMTYEGSTPPAELSGQKLRWSLGTLAPHQSNTIEVRLAAARPGSVTSCAEATSSGGQTARDCVTTTVGVASLQVEMLGPKQVYVGDEVDFRIVITNRGQATATGLSILDRFDPGLEHAEAKNQIEKMLEPLEPGKSIGIGVRFTATRAGNLCHNVEISGPGGVRATGRRCVTVLDRQPRTPGTFPPATPPASVSVRRECPTVAKVGESVVCKIFVSNNGKLPLTNVQIVETADANLYPTNTSYGYKFNESLNQLSWTLPSIPPGKEPVKLTVEYKCQSPSTRACCNVSITTSQGAKDKAESCLRINPQATPPGTPTTPTTPGTPTGRLKVAIIDYHNPVSTNTRATYDITITNESNTPDQDIVLTVTVPPEMSPRQTGNSGPQNVTATISNQEIRFDKIPDLRPGARLKYRVVVDTKTPGTAVLSVSATSKNSPLPVTAQTKTTVQAQ